MTSVTLHSTPRYGTVILEQGRAVGAALRNEGMIFLALLASIGALKVVIALRIASLAQVGLLYGPPAPVLMMCLGVLIPFGVWRSEDPARRSYHWAMPVARGPHTLIKAGMGWLWLMAAVAVYTLFFLGEAGVLNAIVHAPAPAADDAGATWQWLRPFTAASVTYLLVSLAVIGSNHPWRWIGGIVIGYAMAFGTLATLQRPDVVRGLWAVFDGPYGLFRAVLGNGPIVQGQLQASSNGLTISADTFPAMTTWLKATLLWTTVGIVGIYSAAYYRTSDR